MILIIIVVILVAGLGGMWALASFESAHAEALKAQALITANQTTQVSVIGQTVVSVVLAMVVLAILAAIVIGLWLNKLSQTRQAQTGQWLPGPNARWQSRIRTDCQFGRSIPEDVSPGATTATANDAAANPDDVADAPDGYPAARDGRPA